MNNLKQLVGGLIFTGFMPNIFGWFWAVLFKWRENHRVEYTMMRLWVRSFLLKFPPSRSNHNPRAVRITTRKFPPSCPNHNQKVPPELSESQPESSQPESSPELSPSRKVAPEPSESQPESSPRAVRITARKFPPSRPNHNQKVPPEPSESQPESSPRAVRITTRKFPPSRPNHNQKVPLRTARGNFLVAIRTARGELSGCDSDGSGGTFWL